MRYYLSPPNAAFAPQRIDDLSTSSDELIAHLDSANETTLAGV
jgi:hypothetical protein